MRDWRAKLDEFLRFNEREVLPDAGRVTREDADRRAREQFALFEQRRRSEAEQKGEAELIGELEDLAKKAKSRKRQRRKE
jgi:hypothetical protein